MDVSGTAVGYRVIWMSNRPGLPFGLSTFVLWAATSYFLYQMYSIVTEYEVV